MDAIGGPSVGPTRQWFEGEIPFFLTGASALSRLPWPSATAGEPWQHRAE
jgi:hypothetical protein